MSELDQLSVVGAKVEELQVVSPDEAAPYLPAEVTAISEGVVEVRQAGAVLFAMEIIRTRSLRLAWARAFPDINASTETVAKYLQSPEFRKAMKEVTEHARKESGISLSQHCLSLQAIRDDALIQGDFETARKTEVDIGRALRYQAGSGNQLGGVQVAGKNVSLNFIGLDGD